MDRTTQKHTSNPIRRLTTMGMMAAISVVLVYLVHFPIFPVAPYLEYDPADIPIFICTFLYGPGAGFLLTVLASTIQGVTVSAASGWVGVLMHICGRQHLPPWQEQADSGPGAGGRGADHDRDDGGLEFDLHPHLHRYAPGGGLGDSGAGYHPLQFDKGGGQCRDHHAGVQEDFRHYRPWGLK